MNQSTTQYGPYTISGADGKPLDPDARFFVLRYDSDAPHGFFARQALRLYCALIKGKLPGLSDHLWDDLQAESYAEESSDVLMNRRGNEGNRARNNQGLGG